MKGNGAAPATTVDALTAEFHKQDINANNFDRTPAQDDVRTLKERVLAPESGGKGLLPTLNAWLHDQVWSEGGELTLHLGGGKDNDGRFSDEKELERAIENVIDAAQAVGCTASVLRRGVLPKPAEENNDPHPPSSEHQQEDDRAAGTGEVFYSAHLMVRRIPASAQELLEIRIAVVGNVDAGKSTMLGVLTKGTLDDGRGKARVNLFRHKHEIESGRTSSVGMEIMGYDAAGKPVVSQNAKEGKEDSGRKLTWEEICEKAAKVISFIDLAGHENYLKTTLFGMTGCLPDFVVLMVGANAGLIGMSKEHLGIALALAVPVVVCITKVDMTPVHILEATIKQLTKILRSPGCRKTPIFIHTMNQVVDTALRLNSDRICPVFQISNVTGMNMDLLRAFLNILPQAPSAKFKPDKPFEYQISDTFSVPFVGTVVSGVILSGRVKVGDSLLIGPDSLGQFMQTAVRSIQRKRVNVEGGSAGQSVSFALKRIRRNQVRKGMVMLSRNPEGGAQPKAFMEFDAEILCLYHSTTLSIGSCMVLHAASIRQTVKIVGILHLTDQGLSGEGEQEVDTKSTANVVRTGDRARLRLRFIRFGEYVKPGLKLITREGKTKLIGVVRSVGTVEPLSYFAKHPDAQGTSGTASTSTALNAATGGAGAGGSSANSSNGGTAPATGTTGQAVSSARTAVVGA
ncbi:P-loop containing nucleoside triphosphate hydrolase protein [Tilletiaria anomala UBC 951]|uniref:p-loop containing nucleoside triphosphate hydrolase protein n=1 Tax=Tilletiaria anomala (strain ATCC 24038 / CBS 436.72 / UBC 951) TaxID=1037660 RepID=A0A066W9J7_TILAU|nr:P-loop containing nucleoside triphosphate hydrolase protein [Tilletiaria anomala UBC 951]KDN50381.1 P-loop containing nucleoside triphosphate hydrolase protein [Tilletiaria anomala UBC 951]